MINCFNPYLITKSYGKEVISELNHPESIYIMIECSDETDEGVVLRVYYNDIEIITLESITCYECSYIPDGGERIYDACTCYSAITKKGLRELGEEYLFYYHFERNTIDFVAIEATSNGGVIGNGKNKEHIYFYNMPQVETSNTQVKKYYQLALDGNTNAIYNLGVYYSGYDENQFDAARAVYWYRKAADRGFDLAIRKVTNLYAGGEGGMGWMSGFGDWSEKHKNIHLYAKYAQLGYEQGIPYCVYCMGNIYAEGLAGYKKDLDMAITCWEDVLTLDFEECRLNENNANSSISACKAILSSYINLGVSYLNGFGVKKDICKAITYFEEAAKKGSKNAASRLVSLYSDGEFIQKDDEKARYWYEVSKKCIPGL